MIPKIIYQTWYTKNIPERIKDIIDNMLSKNKKYQHKLFDDREMEEYIFNNFDERTIKAFNMLKIGAAKADLWRYLILYKDGGVYLDIDSEITSNLDDLISDDDFAIITRERNPEKFVQWCLMFSPNHPILKICIDKCLVNILEKKYSDILKLTGPDVFSESIFEYCSKIKINPFWALDGFINKTLFDNDLKLRLYGFDYENFCVFRNKFADDLYKEKMDWREEQSNSSIFKN